MIEIMMAGWGKIDEDIKLVFWVFFVVMVMFVLISLVIHLTIGLVPSFAEQLTVFIDACLELGYSRPDCLELWKGQ